MVFSAYNKALLLSLKDIEVQLQYTSLNVTEEDSTAKLCIIMTVGAVERNVTVVLQTNPITGMFPIIMCEKNYNN